MSANSSVSDIEERLEVFFVRNPTHRHDSTDDPKEGPIIHENIPLALNDILRVSTDLEREDVFTISINKTPCHFRTCVVYAFVLGECPSHKSYRKYIVDDGTALLNVSIATKLWNRETIACLYEEAALLSDDQECPEDISESMMRLLTATSEYVNPSGIQHGNSVLLLCRPNFFREKLSLQASSFLVDKGMSRGLEIAFADHYVDWHTSYKLES